MKLLRCKFCRGEVEIIDGWHNFKKRIKCCKCGFTNNHAVEQKGPEIFVIKKRAVV
jgi:hypothetical protein